jgi:hypothetical protein
MLYKIIPGGFQKEKTAVNFRYVATILTAV